MRSIRYSTGIALVVVAIIYVLYAVRVFPIPGTDSSSFLPPALTFAQGRGLANPFYYLSRYTDTSGQGLYNYYVPGYSWFLGYCVQAVPGVKTVFAVCAILTIAALAAYRREVVRMVPENAGWGVRLLAVLSVVYLATYSLPTIGRPEQLTTPLCLLLYLLYRGRTRFANWLYNALLVVLFAVLLVTQVTSFYFAFLVFLIAEFAGEDAVGRTLVVNALRAVGVGLLFCALMTASPNGLTATLDGISAHSKLLFMRGGRSVGQFAFYWLFSPFNAGFLLVCAVCLRYWWLHLRIAFEGMAAANKWIVLLLHVGVAAGIAMFVVHTPPTVYNLTQFIYVLLLFAWGSHGRYDARWSGSLMLPSLGVAFLMGSLVFLRTFVLFVDNEVEGKTYDAAKQKLSEVEGRYGRCVTQLNLWSLYDDPYRVVTIEKRYVRTPVSGVQPSDIIVIPKDDSLLRELRPGDREGAFYHVLHPGDVVVMPQAYKDIPPALLARSEVLEDWRTENVRRLWGVPLSRHPYGYSFLVLRVK